MHVIFLDGESKSGKTAVGRSMLEALELLGDTVRLVVAGNYFRHLTVLALEHKPDNAADDSWLEQAAREALVSPLLLGPAPDTAQLEQPEVERLVSVLGQFGFVQDAVADWRIGSAQKALDDDIDILIFDGRNLRSKLKDWCQQYNVPVTLELLVYCRPEVAAARRLADSGVQNPGEEQVTAATEEVINRRQRDRERGQAAFVDPDNPVPLVVGTDSVDTALALAFAPDVVDPPRPIRFDNSEVPRADGLRTVTELAVKAVSTKTS